MKARIESLGRTLLRAAEIAVREVRVGAQECGPMRRLALTTPPPNRFTLSAYEASIRPLRRFYAVADSQLPRARHFFITKLNEGEVR